MDIRELSTVLLKKWWLILGLPLIVFIAMVWRSSDPPYISSFRATILMPGDTEIPGNSERPELMILDDLPELVKSQAFASDIAVFMLSSGGQPLSTDEIHDSLSADRYSRVLTVHSTNDSATDAETISKAAAMVLPAAVNQYLVADGAAAATVNVIDSPSTAVPDNENRWLIVGIETLVALGLAVGVSLALYGLRRNPNSQPTTADIETHAG
jgi:capsular polysaccharide biosynthesis protein